MRRDDNVEQPSNKQAQHSSVQKTQSLAANWQQHVVNGQVEGDDVDFRALAEKARQEYLKKVKSKSTS